MYTISVPLTFRSFRSTAEWETQSIKPNWKHNTTKYHTKSIIPERFSCKLIIFPKPPRLCFADILKQQPQSNPHSDEFNLSNLWWLIFLPWLPLHIIYYSDQLAFIQLNWFFFSRDNAEYGHVKLQPVNRSCLSVCWTPYNICL